MGVARRNRARRRRRPRGPKGYGLLILAPNRSRERLRCSPGFELGRRCSAGGRRREPGGGARRSVVTGSTRGVSGYWICRRGPCGPCEGGPGVRRTWTSPAASNRAGGATLPEMASGSIPARWAPGVGAEVSVGFTEPWRCSCAGRSGAGRTGAAVPRRRRILAWRSGAVVVS